MVRVGNIVCRFLKLYSGVVMLEGYIDSLHRKESALY